MSVVATYDSLRLIDAISQTTALRSSSAGATEQEVHALAYLACQLARWTSPELPWQYGFHSTSQSDPFAIALADALRTLRTSGLVEDAGQLLRLTDDGRRLLSRLNAHLSVRERQSFLQAAGDAAVVLPIPLVLHALAHEPTVARAVTTQRLMDETSTHVLLEYYAALRATLGEDASLLSLTELWLQYLLATMKADAAGVSADADVA